MAKLSHPWCHIVMVRGGGDVATGVLLRLHRSGFKVAFTEIERPLSVRRNVCFSEAVYDGSTQVEGVTSVFVHDWDGVERAWDEGQIPGLVDPHGDSINTLKPDVLVDAIMAKRNLGTKIDWAPLTIGLGPGFEAGRDVHVVVETKRGHSLGRVILKGPAEEDTGEPEAVMGYTHERVIRAPSEGKWLPCVGIGEAVQKGQVIGRVGDTDVVASISGVIRGLIRPDIQVSKGLKIGDIDPRGKKEYCNTVSDKALAIGGGVLEAILMWCSSGHNIGS